MKYLFMPFMALALLAFPTFSHADSHGHAKANVAVDTVAAQGYDLVSYHLGDGAPEKGNGNNVAYHDNVTYLFANADNKKAFESNPSKYLPAYGGYCAYGVSKGKKFIGDPLVYRVVDGKLYLNLAPKVQKLWNEDVSGNISTADETWGSIKDKHASEL